MFHYRRRRYRKIEEEIRSLIPLSNPVPISSNISSREFISAVMALRYRPKISLEDLATAEQEFIGEGQSFRVEKAFMDSSDSSLQVVALKHPLFSDGTTNDSTHWNRLWLEVRSLMHPPLAAHPNIIDLLAIGWQRGLSNTKPELEWPVLVMPYATNGTLDAFQWSPVLGEKEKVSMCLDVALGLKALHGCGVVHGDLKSENVLVFAEKGGPVARLCDFGCSIIGPQALGNLAGGSQPWNCPEWKDTLLKENFPLTDVYSFGLLVWRTLSTNRRPYQALQYFVENSLLSEDDIDRLKRLPNDRFLEEVKESIKSTCAESEEKGLFEQVLHHTIRFNPRQRSLDQAVVKLEELLKLKNGGNMPYVLTRTVVKLLRQPSHTSRVESGSCGFSKIDSAPLEIDMSFDPRAARSLSWQHQVDMFEFHRTFIASNVGQLTGAKIMESSLLLFFCYLQGIGININKSVATQYLLRSAEAGDLAARALSYRAIVAFAGPLPNSIQEKTIAQWLCRSIELGCFGAKDDFQHLIASQNADTAAALRRWYQVSIGRLRCFTAGVGAGHFLDDRGSRLNPLSIEDQEKFEVEIARHACGDKFDINTFTLNSRGDLLLHFASTCGFSQALRFLVQNFGRELDINAINKDGETALLSASRAGQTETVRILLANGADLRPGISGENPLHWLAMFDVEDIPELALSMVQRPVMTDGAVDPSEKRRLWLRQKASTTKWSNYWDSELPPGTPLHRAVYFKNLVLIGSLLDLGADPLEPSSGEDSLSPIELACTHHQAAIVEAMLDKLGIADVKDIPVRPLLHLALLSRDDLTSLVVNGVHFQVDVLKTLVLLSSRGASPGLMSTQARGSNDMRTALFEAVLSGSQQSVELALSGRLLTSLDLLNTRCGEKLLTPLHMAVQRGSLSMVASLLDAKSDVTIPSGSGFLTTLHFCATMDSSSPHSHSIFNRLLPFFDSVDQSYDSGETPFVMAVRLLKFDLATALLENGANIDFEFSRGDDDLIIREPTTILGLLLQQMNPAGLMALQFLLGYDRDGRKKADWKYRLPSPIVNTRHGMTVFHIIAMRRRKPLYAIEIVKEMMSYLSETYGSNLDLVNQRSATDLQPTALHIAAHCTNIEIVASLLRLGASTDVVDDDDFKPVNYALSVMAEDLEVDESQGWTEIACRREIERRKAVHEMLSWNKDVFEITGVDALEVLHTESQ